MKKKKNLKGMFFKIKKLICFHFSVNLCTFSEIYSSCLFRTLDQFVLRRQCNLTTLNVLNSETNCLCF